MPKLRGSSWQTDVRLGTKRHRYSFNSEADAISWETQAREDYKAGREIAPPDKYITLGEFSCEMMDVLWTANKDEIGSQQALRLIVEHVGTDTPVSSVDSAVLAKARDDLIRIGNTGGTVNRKLSALSRLLHAAEERRLIPYVPKVKTMRETRGRDNFLSKDVLHQVFNAFERLGRNDHTSLVLLLYYTGGRFSEVRNLLWTDVSDTHVVFRDTKSGGSRKVPLTTQARAALDGLKDAPTGPFKSVTYRTFKSHWNRVAETLGKSGDKDFCPHILRHTCASHLALAGVDLRRIQEWMGHKNISMTMRYAHMLPSSLDEVVGALG